MPTPFDWANSAESKWALGFLDALLGYIRQVRVGREGGSSSLISLLVQFCTAIGTLVTQIVRRTLCAELKNSIPLFCLPSTHCYQPSLSSIPPPSPLSPSPPHTARRRDPLLPPGPLPRPHAPAPLDGQSGTREGGPLPPPGRSAGPGGKGRGGARPAALRRRCFLLH